MSNKETPKSEKEVKTETASKFVRMKKDGIIQSVPKNEVDAFKKKGFTEV